MLWHFHKAQYVKQGLVLAVPLANFPTAFKPVRYSHRSTFGTPVLQPCGTIGQHSQQAILEAYSYVYVVYDKLEKQQLAIKLNNIVPTNLGVDFCRYHGVHSN